MIITATSIKIIPNAIYTKNAGKIFSSTPIINARIAIIDIPIPIVLHNFFSSYFSFSSFVAVLYPEINQLPCPESKVIESTANIAKTIHTIQSEPVAKSANFIYMLLEFQFSKLSIPSSCHSNKKYLSPNALGQSRFELKPKRLLMPLMLFSFLLLFQFKHSLFFRLFFLAISLFTLLFVMFLL